jgi:hypothetical protein
MSSMDDESPFALSELDIDISLSNQDEGTMSYVFKSDLDSYEKSLKELEKRIEKTSFAKSTAKATESSIKDLEKYIVDALSLTLNQRTEIFQQARKDYDKHLKLTRRDLENALKRRIKLEDELEEWKIKYNEIKEAMDRLTANETNDDRSGMRKRHVFNQLEKDQGANGMLNNHNNTKNKNIKRRTASSWKNRISDYAMFILLFLMLSLNIYLLYNYYN